MGHGKHSIYIIEFGRPIVVPTLKLRLGTGLRKGRPLSTQFSQNRLTKDIKFDMTTIDIFLENVGDKDASVTPAIVNAIKCFAFFGVSKNFHPK